VSETREPVVERFTFEVTDEEAAQALREQAAAHGRSVEAELDALVRKTYSTQNGAEAEPPGEEWVDELIRITRPGFEIDPFPRIRTVLREPDL
jgi:plasmid stability protein